MQNPSSYNGSGTTVTDIQQNSSASMVNGPTFNSSGTRYMGFDGANDYLITTTSLNADLSPANTSTVISIFAWVYMLGNGMILSEQGTSTVDSAWYDGQIELVSGTLRFSVWPYTAGVPKITSSIATNLNTWYYVGFTYDGTTLRAYVNDGLAGSSTYARISPYNDNSGRGLYYTIAYRSATNQGSTTYANMRLGAFHIYNTALSQIQIADNYRKSKTIYGV